MRRVTKTGARFHVTDFWGEVYTPRQASVLMVSWVSSRSVQAPPPARPTRGGPSLRMAFGSQYPHTHTHPYLAGCFALAESPLDHGWQTRTGPGAVAGSRWVPSPPEPCSPACLSWD